MQAVVNPGEAKQIEQDYAHTTLASVRQASYPIIVESPLAELS